MTVTCMCGVSSHLEICLVKLQDICTACQESSQAKSDSYKLGQSFIDQACVVVVILYLCITNSSVQSYSIQADC